jgi:hypothetical protein
MKKLSIVTRPNVCPVFLTVIHSHEYKYHIVLQCEIHVLYYMLLVLLAVHILFCIRLSARDIISHFCFIGKIFFPSAFYSYFDFTFRHTVAANFRLDKCAKVWLSVIRRSPSEGQTRFPLLFGGLLDISTARYIYKVSKTILHKPTANSGINIFYNKCSYKHYLQLL